MPKLKYVVTISLVVCFSLVVLAATFPSASQNQSQKQGPQEPIFERFPITDLSQEADPAQKTKRAKKAKRHNLRYAPAISESSENTYLKIDWEVNLPALPVERSSAIIIGRINKSEAQLSENRTGIYSEFTVHVESVLKNDSKTPIDVDTSIVVNRTGGRVRLPSGKIVVSSVEHQDMPQVGSRYVLFLTHHSLQGGEDEDFYILTGYELKNGKALPLDKVSEFHPISRYTGVSETILLTGLSSALAKSSPNLPIK